MTIKFNPNFLPEHDELKGKNENNHHTKFDANDHSTLNHEGIPGIPQKLSELKDIDTNGLSDGQALVWDSDNNKFKFHNVKLITYSSGLFAAGYGINDDLRDIETITIETSGNGQFFGNLTGARHGISGLSNGSNDRGIFANGFPLYGKYIEYITISNKSNSLFFGYTVRGKKYAAGTSNNIDNRGIISSGLGTGNNEKFKDIDYFNILTTGNSATFGDVSTFRYSLGATSNGVNNRGLFIGGSDKSQNLDSIEYITITSLGNGQFFGNLTTAKSAISATSNLTSNICIIIQTNIEQVNISTLGNSSVFGNLTVPRWATASTSNGINNRGVIAGGGDGSNKYANIDYVTINIVSNASLFGYLENERSTFAATSNA